MAVDAPADAEQEGGHDVYEGDQLKQQGRASRRAVGREPAPPSAEQDGHTIAKGAEALLREHPTAQVCALAGNGLIVPVPQTVGLWGQGLIEGRALIDNVIAADRTAVVRLWISAGQEGAAATKVRMLATPEQVVDASLPRPARSARRVPRRDPAERRGRRQRPQRP